MGSQSKLRTFRDGFRILRTIVLLVKEERPLQFFSVRRSAAGARLARARLAADHRPSSRPGWCRGCRPRSWSTGLMVLAFLSFVAGLMLDTVTLGRRELKRLHYLALQGPTFRERRRSAT